MQHVIPSLSPAVPILSLSGFVKSISILFLIKTSLKISLFKKLCTCVCMCVGYPMPMELEIQGGVSHPTWVPKLTLNSSPPQEDV